MRAAVSRSLPFPLIPVRTRLAASLASLTALAGCGAVCTLAGQSVGANLAWHTQEAESARVRGTVLGETYGPFRVEMESSGQRCVQLSAPGDYLEFDAAQGANALVVRFNLPDAAQGGGTTSALELWVNDRLIRTVSLSSRYAWLYGAYPFTNNPTDGKPRNFYDELRLKDLSINPGDTVRLRLPKTAATPCVVDLIDLENVPAPLRMPPGARSIAEFGATGDGSDATVALLQCIEAARKSGQTVFIPAGNYTLTRDVLLPSNVTLQGAGMWHTVFTGDEDLYIQPDRRVRFKMTGSNIHLADFAIVGRLNHRDDSEPNDGIVGAGCSDSSVRRIWIEHTKAGVWVYNGARLVIEGCRFRNLLADGVNFCVGTHHSVVENCSARGTGDDCFAIWPAPADQGYDESAIKPGHNVIRRSTGQLPFLANGGAIYGGESNRIENCLFTDITAGCGVLISTSFPTTDAERKIDNNFSGTTVVENCRLVRCGGYDHTWAWRASVQICMERKSISGVVVRDLTIDQSLSDAVSIVAPGGAKKEGTLSNTRLERVVATATGIGNGLKRGLWIRGDASGGLHLIDCALEPVANESTSFQIEQR